MSSTGLPDAVVDFIRTQMNADIVGEPTRAVGGYSNITAHLVLRGDRGAADRRVVAKAASTPLKREDLHHEVRSIAALRRQPFGTAVVPYPDVLAHGDGDGFTVTVMSEISGVLGVSELESLPVSVLRERAAVLGEVLGWLHDGHNVHGDPGFHNTLWSSPRTLSGLIDWEFAATAGSPDDGPGADPLRDLAWFWWTLQFRGVDDSVWRAFLGGYGSGRAEPIRGRSADVEPVLRAQMTMLAEREREREGSVAIWDARAAMLPTLLSRWTG